MKNMSGMENYKLRRRHNSEPPLTAATIVSTQTPLAPGVSETAHRDGVAANELPNDMARASRFGKSNTFQFGVGDALWAKPLIPTKG